VTNGIRKPFRLKEEDILAPASYMKESPRLFFKLKPTYKSPRSFQPEGHKGSQKNTKYHIAQIFNREKY